jgi:hypothetical protein
VNVGWHSYLSNIGGCRMNKCPNTLCIELIDNGECNYIVNGVDYLDDCPLKKAFEEFDETMKGNVIEAYPIWQQIKYGEFDRK